MVNNEPNDRSQRGLEGIRLLEIAGGFGPAWMAKLFADLGADVIRFEDHDDLIRSRPHDVHRWINANKRSATTDLSTLMAEADIIVHGLGPEAAAERGLDYDQLVAAAGPSVVVASVTPFGASGPYADFAGEEINLIHSSSWGFLSPAAATDEELPPLKAAGHHASILVANVAAAATLAAFDKAERTGAGDFVDFSSFAAAAKMTETAPVGASFQGNDASRLGMRTIEPWNIFECADGLMHVICVETTQWESLLDLMGRPEWTELEIFDSNEGRRDNADLLHLYLAEWMATQNVAELYRAAQEARIPLTPLYTMPQIETDPHLESRGFFKTTPDGLRIPGAGFQTDQDWWNLRSDAPTLGEHDGQGWLARDAGSPADDAGNAGKGGSASARPLEGIRVCDFTWVWAGPFCTQYLAHLGADVIRIESPDHPCLFRRLPFNPPDVPLDPDSAGVYQWYNSDKRGITLNLRHPDVTEIIHRLVATSDVVIDNFGVGVMADLGFGVDALRAINPDVVVASLTGYGQTGPSAGYMAYGPAGGAFSGLYASTGYEGAAPVETGVAVGDPCTGITAAWSIVAALVARRRNQEVARVDVAMVEAIASSIGEVWMEYLADGSEPPRRGNRDVQWAPHNCYPTATTDEWVTIACSDDEAWRSLATVIDPTLLDDERFTTTARRKQNEAELDQIVEAWTASGERWDLAKRLQDVGVAAMPSLSPLDLWAGDPQLEAIGMLERPEHPVTGSQVVAGIPWRLTNAPNGIRRAAPALGQHTVEVLDELLGFTAEEIDALRANGALG